MEEEKITASKLVKGAVKPKTGIKAFVFGLWIFVFVATGFTVYRAYFRPLPTQNIKAEKGSNVNIYNQPKKFFIPFIEGGVEQRSNADMGTYIRAGIRIEF